MLLIIGFICCTMMLSWEYINIHYLCPLLVVLLFVCSPTYVCFNIAYHQTCWPLRGLCLIFLQDIHVLSLHGPNWWKIIIYQIIAQNWKGFWHCHVFIIQITLGHFLSSCESCSSWWFGKFNFFLFYYTFFIYINLKVLCVNVMEGNTKVLNEKLNLLWPGFLRMVFHMLLAFHIILITSKCCIQHTYYNRWKS